MEEQIVVIYLARVSRISKNGDANFREIFFIFFLIFM